MTGDGIHERTRWSKVRRPPSARWLAGGATVVVLFVSAACGSGGTASSASTATSATRNSGTTSSPVVDVATVGSLGAVLVTRAGRTLYRYAPDGTGRSVCTGECASAWPPLTVPAGTEHVAGGARIPGSDLGTTTRSDGTLQVTYRGMPLYTYVGDAKAGDATGQGLGGTWFVVPTSSSPASTTTSPPSPGGHGY